MSKCTKPSNEFCRIHNPANLSTKNVDTVKELSVKIENLFTSPSHLSKNTIKKTNNTFSLEKLGNKIRTLSNDAADANDTPLQIEGVKSYLEIMCNNESDLNMFFVIPEKGEPFSTFNYGIHSVRYNDKRETICYLNVEENRIKPYDFYFNENRFADNISENEDYDSSKTKEIVDLVKNFLKK